MDEVTPQGQNPSAAPTTRRKGDREPHSAEIRAGSDAKRTKKKARSDTKRDTQLIRKKEGKNRRSTSHAAEEVAIGLRLQVELQFAEADGDSELATDQLAPIEIVRATNRDDIDVLLTRIETIQGAIDGADLPTSQFTIGPGESYSFVSGLKTEDAAGDEYRWMSKVVCIESGTGQGYRLKAAFSRDAENHEFIVYCDGPFVAGVVDTPSKTSGAKRKRNHHRHHKKKR